MDGAAWAAMALLSMPDDYVRSTAAALKKLNPDYLIPMHCSGTTLYEMAKQEMPGRVLLSSTSTRVVVPPVPDARVPLLS